MKDKDLARMDTQAGSEAIATAPAAPATSHTPGEWYARMQETKYGKPLGWIIETSDVRAGRIGWASRAYGDTNQEAPIDSAECAANARLIAAAPELLAALAALVESCVNTCDIAECGCASSQLFVAARAAIAKAEGR